MNSSHARETLHSSAAVKETAAASRLTRPLTSGQRRQPADASTYELITLLPSQLRQQQQGDGGDGCRRAQRRRHALDHFYSASISRRMSQREPDDVRLHLAQLWQQTRDNVAAVSSTQTCLLDMFGEMIMKRPASTSDTTSATTHIGDDSTLSVAEKLLYVILRTSVLANTNTNAAEVRDHCSDVEEEGWCSRGGGGAYPYDSRAAAIANTSTESLVEKKSKVEDADGTFHAAAQAKKHHHIKRRKPLPIEPRLWVSPSTVALAERSARFHNTMRWGCDPDPVVDALMGCSGHVSRFGQDSWMHAEAKTQAERHVARACDDLLAATAAPFRPRAQSKAAGFTWSQAETSDVEKLFAKKKDQLLEDRENKDNARLRAPDAMVPATSTSTRASSPCQVDVATNGREVFSIFSNQYNNESELPICSMVYVTLHRCFIGVRDPYLLVTAGGVWKNAADENDDWPSSPTVFFPRGAKRPAGSAAVMSPACQEPFLSLSSEFVLKEDTTTATTTTTAKKRRKMDPVSGRVTTLGAEGGHAAAQALQQPRPSRGLLSIVQWACEHGTLFLRLQRLCDLAQRKENKPGLASYGQCAMDALRVSLSLMRRQVVELADRPGGPHNISFTDLMEAHQRLERIGRRITVLADVLKVSTSPDWDALSTLQSLSSAALLSTLYNHFAASNINAYRDHLFAYEVNANGGKHRQQQDGGGDGKEDDDDDNEDDEKNLPALEREEKRRDRLNRLSGAVDAVAFIFTATLRPLHRMIHAWLTRGELSDPLDEFFIIPSHGTTRSGFTLDCSPHRLPCFISVEAAQEMLHAGVSLRVLRAAATHVIVSAESQKRVLNDRGADGSVAEDVNEGRFDAQLMHTLIKEFLQSLVGQRSPTQFHPVPQIHLLHRRGGLSYWRGYYGACNSILIEALVENEMAAGEGSGSGSDADDYDTLSPLKLHEEEQLQQEGVGQRDGSEDRQLQLAVPTHKGKEGDGVDDEDEDNEDAKSHITIAMFSGSDASPTTSPSRPVAEPDEVGSDTAVSLMRRGSSGTSQSLLGLGSIAGKNSMYLRGSTTFSTASSRATTGLYGAISEEIRQVVQAEEQQQMDSGQSRLTMKKEYESRMFANKRASRLLEWKAQRMSLRTERVQVLRAAVDDMQHFYEELKAAEAPGEGASTEELEDASANPFLGKIVMPFTDDEMTRMECVAPPVILYPTAPDPSALPHRHVVGFHSYPMPQDKVRLDASTSVFSSRIISAAVTPTKAKGYQASTPLGGMRLPSRRASQSLAGAVGKYSVVGGSAVQQQQPRAYATPLSVTNGQEDSVKVMSDEEGEPTVPAHALQYDEEGLSHPADIYVIADINDEEYLSKRVLPRQFDQLAHETLRANMAATHAQLQLDDVNSPAYQARCAAVAKQRVEKEKKSSLGNASDAVVARTVASVEQQWELDDPRLHVDDIWRAPLADVVEALEDAADTGNTTRSLLETFESRLVLADKRASRLLADMELSTQQADAMQWCARYYLTLSRYTAGYLTHKALQMALMPPYGSLYRLIKQLMDICLMQSRPVAARMVDMWETQIAPAMERGLFQGKHHQRSRRCFSGTECLAELNRHFRKEWEQCAVSGGDTLNLHWELDDGSGASTGSHQNDSALSRRSTRTVGDESRWLDETELDARAQQSKQAVEEEEDEGTDVSSVPPSATSSSPLLFLGDLVLQYEKPCGGFWLLPDGVVSDYSDMFCTLLFWKTSERLLTQTWLVAMRCGESDVFYFCNTTRFILSSLQQHLWNNLQVLSSAYADTLLFESGVLYKYRCLEQFTEDHRRFVVECRFAAMLSPAFAKCRQLIYGMLRQVEEVERALRVVHAEMLSMRRKAMAAYRELVHSDHEGDSSDSDGGSSSSGDDSSDMEMYLAPLEEAISKLPASTAKKIVKKKKKKKKPVKKATRTSTTTTTTTTGALASTRRSTASTAGSSRSVRTATDTNSARSTSTAGVVRKKKRSKKLSQEGAGATASPQQLPKPVVVTAPPILSEEDRRSREEGRKALRAVAEKTAKEQMEVEKRHLRELVRRRLRALSGMVEELIEQLSAVRDACSSCSTSDEHSAAADLLDEDRAALRRDVAVRPPLSSFSSAHQGNQNAAWVDYCHAVYAQRAERLDGLVRVLESALVSLHRKI